MISTFKALIAKYWRGALGLFGSIALFLSLRYWKRRVVSLEAQKEIQDARASVEKFEILRDRVRDREGENAKLIKSIDLKIEESKRKAVKHVAEVDGMTAEEVAREFERLGY